jgi:hypothetical protein
MFAKHACAKRAQQTRNVVRLCIEMQLKTNKYQKMAEKVAMKWPKIKLTERPEIFYGRRISLNPTQIQSIANNQPTTQ